MSNSMENEETRKALQTCCRHLTIKNLLADLATDTQVCALEGWDIREYPRMILMALKDIRSFKGMINL